MNKTLLGLFIAIAVAGCDTVEGMRDMTDKQEQVRGIIKEEIGIAPLVGFKIDDDVLIDVSIAFSAEDVADRSVSELQRVARYAVKQSFAEKPRAIYIQIATTAE